MGHHLHGLESQHELSLSTFFLRGKFSKLFLVCTLQVLSTGLLLT